MTGSLKTELKIGQDPHTVFKLVYKHCKQKEQLACISFEKFLLQKGKGSPPYTIVRRGVPVREDTYPKPSAMR